MTIEIGPGIVVGSGITVAALPNGSALFTRATPTYLSTTLTGNAPGTNSITYEWWFRTTTSPAGITQGMLQTRTNTSGGDGIDISIVGGGITVSTSGNFLLGNGSTGVGTVLVNTWYHIAAVRTGTTAWVVYLNGSSIGTFSFTNTTGAQLYLGEKTGGSSGEAFNGYISNFRYVNGTAVYSANFTPPTQPLLAISGTQLLLNTPSDASFLTDNSSNSYTITNNNAVTSAALNPF